MPFDGTPVTEVQLTLMAARELVAKRWCKRSFVRQYKNGPGYCIVGAIRHVVLDGEVPDGEVVPIPLRARLLKAEAAFKNALPAYEYPNIERWNDAKDRKKEEVLEAFDRAIARA